MDGSRRVFTLSVGSVLVAWPLCIVAQQAQRAGNIGPFGTSASWRFKVYFRSELSESEFNGYSHRSSLWKGMDGGWCELAAVIGAA